MLDYIKRHLFWIVPTLFFVGLPLVVKVCLWFISFIEITDDRAEAQLIGGGIIGWGALFGIGVAAWRNHELNRQATAALRQAAITEKQQASEQLVETIKLLARSDQEGTPLIEARIGALYNLEALASTHPTDYGAQVMKTIASYIGENAQKTARDKPSEPDKRTEPSPLGKDVLTAFAVLKRLYDEYAHALIAQGRLRRFTYMPLRWIDDIDFSRADFRKLILTDVEWIERPTLRRAQLQGAKLNLAQLKGAVLWYAQLQGANLHSAELQGASLLGANLQKADLRNTHLQGADLPETQWQETDLRGAYLDYSQWHDIKMDGKDKKLWQPQSAQILCDKDFPPLTYGHETTQRLDPNDTEQDWQKGWTDVLQVIPTSICHEVVTMLLTTVNYAEKERRSVQGLGHAIKALEDYETLKEKLDEELQKWLDEEIS